ncbi:MAG: hypothetical protein M3016_01160 [Actinomycetota bacterium]|nr:hypothetical protein [Actinomycetota bacterium]
MSFSPLAAATGVASPPETNPATAAPRRWTPWLFTRRHPWWATGLGIVLLAVVIVRWAGTRPGFDPYGWLVWGHQTLSLSLDTNAAPSWKPLPYLFTVPYSLFGHYELTLWMITVTAVSLAGAVLAGRIAYRLTAPPPERRWPGILAGVLTGAMLLSFQDYAHYVLSSQSDPMIVTLCLGAIDCHLHRRSRAAFVLGGLACLGRPEVWPFVGLYSLWAWRARSVPRGLLVGGWVVIAALWFGIPALSSRSPFVAASNAMGSGRRLTSGKIVGTVGRFLSINELPVELAALLAVALAGLRRARRRPHDQATLILAAGAASWVVIEIAFALHGWPGLARYMWEAGGVVVVLAGVAVGRLLSDRPPLPRLPAWTGPVLVAALVVSLIPMAVTRGQDEHADLKHQRLRTTEIRRLTPAIDRLGGAARLRGCGEPLTRLQYQTMLAYTLGINVSRIGFKYGQAIAHGNPIVLFTPTAGGWRIQGIHQVASQCRSLPRAG